MTTLPTTFDDNNTSLIYTSKRLKLNFCSNALGDDSTLIHSSSWQQHNFCSNASNSAASLAHASKRQKPTAQGNTLGKHACVGLRPVRAKALHIKALRMLLSLQDVPTPFNITRGVTLGCTLLPLRGVNLQCTPTRGNILCCALFLLGCIK